MCDLWRYTTTTDTPPGAIPAQVAAARERLRRERPPVAHLKLYNAGSFFDSRAVPEEDYEAVAAEVLTARDCRIPAPSARASIAFQALIPST